MSFLSGPAPPSAPPPIPVPPIFGQVQGKKPQAKSTTPTYLGTGSVPSSPQAAQKTLLGQ